MKKIIFTLFLLFIPNISIAEFVTMNCEGQIREITTDIKGKTSKTCLLASVLHAASFVFGARVGGLAL